MLWHSANLYRSQEAGINHIGGGKKASGNNPVFITDGELQHVLLAFNEHKKFSADAKYLLCVLVMREWE